MTREVLTSQATVTCPHGGLAVPAGPTSRVMVGGAPVVPATTTYLVVGCPAAPPCVMIRLLGGTVRVRVSGEPIATTNDTGVAMPSGERVEISASQSRVRAS